MALTLTPEDGTGLANANSYASLADFAGYAEAHLYTGAWASADDARRSVALAMATRTINALVTFRGEPYGDTQSLDWPRAGVLLPSPVPQRLKDATCELAMDLLSGNRLADPDSAGIAELGLGQGALTLKFAPDDRPEPLTEIVKALLAPLGTIRGIGTGTTRVRRVY